MVDRSTLDRAWNLYHELAPAITAVSPHGRWGSRIRTPMPEFVDALTLAAIAFDVSPEELGRNLSRHNTELNAAWWASDTSARDRLPQLAPLHCGSAGPHCALLRRLAAPR